MNVIKTKKDLLHYLRQLRVTRSRKDVSFVPTMGCFHAGHIELLRRAAKATEISVASIFVNPLQFDDPEDYKSYPAQTEKDLQICKDCGIDLVFVPSPAEMYTERPALQLQMPSLTRNLCGASRPGHFEGVMQAVLRLFHLIRPEIAFFGKKDYQQYLIIKRMLRDLELFIEVVGVETIREADGLACSSRNRRLSEEGRQNASLIYRSLKLGEKAYEDGQTNPIDIKEVVRDVILSGTLNNIEYVEIVSPKDLTVLSELPASQSFLIATAVTCEGVRLIDNLECC